jgi:hypothetical protein
MGIKNIPSSEELVGSPPRRGYTDHFLDWMRNYPRVVRIRPDDVMVLIRLYCSDPKTVERILAFCRRHKGVADSGFSERDVSASYRVLDDGRGTRD